MPATLTVPDPSLVLLVGVAGSGKSTLAARAFAPTQVLSTDAFRAMVADDPADASAGGAAFELLHRVTALRLARRLLTVADARADLLDLARAHGVPAVAIVLDVPPRVCAARRPAVPVAVLRQQRARLRAGLRDLPGEGFAAVHVLGADEVGTVTVAVGG